MFNAGTSHGLCSRFGIVGAFVGKLPLLSIVIAVALTVPSFFGFYFRFRTDFGLDSGFIPIDAPSHREVRVQRHFFGKNSEQWYMALFGVVRDAESGNILNGAEYTEFNNFYNHVTQELNFTVQMPSGWRGGGRNRTIVFRYTDICHPLCDINDQMQKLMDYSYFANIKYPVSEVLGFDLNIGKHVFNRTLEKDGSLSGAKFLAYYYTVFLDEEVRRKQVVQFEREVTRLAAVHNANSSNKVELITHGSDGVISEIQRSVSEWLIYIGIGFGAATLVSVALSAISASLSDERLIGRRAALAVLGTLISLLSVGASVGTLLLLGQPINLIFITSPIVAFSSIINIHSSFHIADSWSRLCGEAVRKQFTRSERLAATFDKIAPSFLLSHTVIFAAFYVAHFFLIRNYSIYASCLALIVLFNFIYEIFLYSAVLALICCASDCGEEHGRHRFFHFNTDLSVTAGGGNGAAAKSVKKPIIRLSENGLVNTRQEGLLKKSQSGQSNGNNASTLTPGLPPLHRKNHRRRQFRVAFAQRIFQPYSQLLSTWYVQLGLALVTAALLYVSIGCGVLQIENQMDYRNVLRADSPSNRAFGLMDTIWADILQIVYILERAPNFERPEEFAEFREFVDAATRIPQAMAARTHMSWVFDYFRNQLDLNYFSAKTVPKSVNMSLFKDFISTFPYNAWQSGVHFLFRNASNELETPQLDKMLVLVAYNDTAGLAGKLRLMRECRRVAARFPRFKIVPFDTDSQTVDVIDAIPRTWLTLLIILLVVSAFVGQFILLNTAAALITTAAIASICAVVYGLAHVLFDFYLDMLSVPASWTIIGQTVFVGIQFASEYLQCWAKEDQQRAALEFTASPLWKSTLAWLALALPQLGTTSPFFAIQCRLTFLGLLVTIWHSMWALPAAFAFLAKCVNFK